MLLQVRNLKTYFRHRGETIKAVDGVDFEIREKEILALVGESGCGKSVTALSLTRLVPAPQGRIVSGEVYFEDKDLLKLNNEDLRTIRGGKISYIFQEPATSLNPVFTIGDQITEAITQHKGLKKDAAFDHAENLLRMVGIPSARERLSSYPHELSGGMKQRAMIAMAISSEPAILIADEPTTALDVTIQAQILDLLNELKQKRALSILLITHDLSIVGQVADRVAVMYLGKVVEYGSLDVIMNKPLHPYTRGLLSCIPEPGRPKERLVAIKGNVPDLLVELPGCPFHPRCDIGDQGCLAKVPELVEAEPGHWVRCGKSRE